MTIAELLARSESLANISDTAALDVALMLGHCLQKNRTYLKTWPERELDTAQLVQFEALLKRRQQGEPVAYLIGSRGFWTLDLAVNASTLIPRPETELLVEQALACLADYDAATILDLGTGTGAIALAIASEHPRWQVVGCDIQPEAVALAEQNRQSHNINNAKFLQSHWFTSIPAQQFDLIVSNPPYIDPNDEHLLQGDVRFEPRSALVSDKSGLADIEQIIAAAQPYLKPNAWLMFEHGYDQGSAVRALMMAVGFEYVTTIQDLASMDRVTQGQWKAEG
ncbi:MAG: release factor glutamine methyltransferase [Pseudohongiellaceae bacterium]|jgi:release factor glutamine methyltransferase